MNHRARIAGVDFGTVRIGIAIADPHVRISSPLAVYHRQDAARDSDYFRNLVEEQSIGRFVVGLPVHMSGDESQKSSEARRFGAWLEAQTSVPVEFFDERYTTVAADQLMHSAHLTRAQRSRRRDMLAAQQMLAAYLESSRRLPESLE